MTDFKLPPALVAHESGDTDPVTVPLVYRVGGADERIGDAVVKIEKGVPKVVGIAMREDGVRLLDLGLVLVGENNPLMDSDKSYLSIRNNRPKPTSVKFEKSQKETNG